jgi:hypothetical protein
MARKDSSPSVGALFVEALGNFCLDLLAMVLCMLAAIYEFCMWLFKWLFRRSG